MLCLVQLLIALQSILAVIRGARGCTLTNVVLVHACGTTLWPDKSQTITHQWALSFETNPFFQILCILLKSKLLFISSHGLFAHQLISVTNTCNSSEQLCNSAHPHVCGRVYSFEKKVGFKAILQQNCFMMF